jgi:hypothetical protein
MGGTERGELAVDTRVRELNAIDRCDRCGAQAYLLVEMPVGAELLFCGHHADEHRGKIGELAEAGATLLDELEKIARKPIAR